MQVLTQIQGGPGLMDKGFAVPSQQLEEQFYDFRLSFD
jgi:hypothetical protein